MKAGTQTTGFVSPEAYEKPSPLGTVGSYIILVAFGYWALQLWRHPVKLNPATFLLWTGLDIWMARSMYKAGLSSWRIMTGFAIGAATIFLLTVLQGTAAWGFGWGEVITLMVFIPAILLGSVTLNKNARANYGTTAMLVAGLPSVVDAWKHPGNYDPVFWWICTLGCLFMLMGSKRGFTEKYMPVGGLILNALIAALAMTGK